MFYIVNPKLTINLSRVEFLEDVRERWQVLEQERGLSKWAKSRLEKGEVFQLSMMPPLSGNDSLGFLFYITEQEAKDLNAALMAFNEKESGK